jgi:hypothetical protein
MLILSFSGTKPIFPSSAGMEIRMSQPRAQVLFPQKIHFLRLHISDVQLSLPHDLGGGLSFE